LIGWLLDTNVLIDLIFPKRPTIIERYGHELAAGTPMFLSSISVLEFRYGAERSHRRDFQLEALSLFLASVTILDFTDRDAHAAARIKTDLAAGGTPIGPYDLLIATQAKVRDLTVATGNGWEFSHVTGLAVEDWNAGGVPG
jgi:tRNA(fMet)-specific endonuclease VapC